MQLIVAGNGQAGEKECFEQQAGDKGGQVALAGQTDVNIFVRSNEWINQCNTYFMFRYEGSTPRRRTIRMHIERLP